MIGELFTRLYSEADLSLNHRGWNGNDDTARNHQGLVPIAEEPIDIALHWKLPKSDLPRLIGFFRLNLPNLCDSGYDRIKFRNGYATWAPEMQVEYLGLRRVQRDGQPCYAIRLGRIIKIKRWHG